MTDASKLHKVNDQMVKHAKWFNYYLVPFFLLYKMPQIGLIIANWTTGNSTNKKSLTYTTIYIVKILNNFFLPILPII